MRDTGDRSGALRFAIRLRIIHPRMDPEDISRRLELNADMLWRAGTPRRTPKGTPLVGIYRETRWGWSEQHLNQRDFFRAAVGLIEKLERHREFLAMIIGEGGTVDLILHLPGDVNIGSSIAAADLRRLADLNINLGIEVFPEFG